MWILSDNNDLLGKENAQSALDVKVEEEGRVDHYDFFLPLFFY
jgi:hypothetical protein